MKKLILIILVSIISSSIYSQSSENGFSIGVEVLAPTRKGFDSYLKVLSDSFNLDKTLVADRAIGLSLGYHSRTNKTEFEAGGSLNFYTIIQNSAATSISISMKTQDISLNFGLNYFLSNYFLIGGHFVINSFEGKMLIESQQAYTNPELSNPPSTDFNILSGYSVALRAQMGLTIPFKKSSVSGFRLIPYYDFGLSNFNFYNNLDNRLANYEGSEKTNFTQFGLKTLIVF